MTKRIRTPSAAQMDRWSKLLATEPNTITAESNKLINVIKEDVDDGFPPCFDELESFLQLVEQLCPNPPAVEEKPFKPSCFHCFIR